MLVPTSISPKFQSQPVSILTFWSERFGFVSLQRRFNHREYPPMRIRNPTSDAKLDQTSVTKTETLVSR